MSININNNKINPFDNFGKLKNDNEIYKNWGIGKIKVPCLWDRGLTGAGVKIAILDTGIAPHIDLVIKESISFVEGETAIDFVGRGTAVAGIIASKNMIERVGVAPDSELYNLKVVSKAGIVEFNSVIKAIEWAISKKINIINLGFVFDQSTVEERFALRDVIKRADASGIIVVTGTGFDSKNLIKYPAIIEQTIPVGATDRDDKLLPLSNFGPGTKYWAPGKEIYTTYLNDEYTEVTGNFFSVAFVTGLIALLLSDKDVNNKEEVIRILNENAVKIAPDIYDIKYGKGRIQAPLKVVDLEIVSNKLIYRQFDAGYLAVITLTEKGVKKAGIVVYIKIIMPDGQVANRIAVTDDLGVDRVHFDVDFSRKSTDTSFGKEGKYLVEAKFEPGLCNSTQIFNTEFEIRSLQFKNWAIARIKAPCLWERGLSGQGVKIGILDTGIAPHKDLVIVKNESFVDGESPMDYKGHGTAVAGVIGSKNLIDRVGVAWNSLLYNLKVIPRDKDAEIKVTDVSNAIDWAIENKLDILNMSFGYRKFNEGEKEILEGAVKRAHKSGIIMVASTGNDGVNKVAYPAAFHQVIGVGSIAKDGSLSLFSNYGLGINYVAPGEQIYTTALNNGYVEEEGTSFSTPLVTGIIALLLSDKNIKTKDQIIDILTKNAESAGGYNIFFGFGKVRAPLNISDLKISPSRKVYSSIDSGYISAVVAIEDGVPKKGIFINLNIIMPDGDIIEDGIQTDAAGVARKYFEVNCSATCNNALFKQEGVYIVEAKFGFLEICYPQKMYTTKFRVSEDNKTLMESKSVSSL